jgi:hypothetical protein
MDLAVNALQHPKITTNLAAKQAANSYIKQLVTRQIKQSILRSSQKSSTNQAAKHCCQ